MKMNFHLNKINQIAQNPEVCISYFKEINPFKGPSLFFHNKAIWETEKDKKLLYIYGTLVSWGMHKMGPNGPKMKDFEDFTNSVNNIEYQLNKLANVKLENLSEDNQNIQMLLEVFESINIMDNETQLVGNSKVLAHLLPEIVPPIDRQYTLSYIFDSTYISKSISKQKDMFKNILINFFLKLSKNKNIKEYYKRCFNESQHLKYHWYLSYPKFLDNLVIGAKLYYGK